jgi:acyl-CoA thioester hydrolase
MSTSTLLSTSQIPFRWADMDVNGHINNVQYLRCFEQARLEWVGHTVVHPEWGGEHISLVIVRLECDFLIETGYPGTAEVQIHLVKLGRSSVTIRHELRVVGDDRIRAAGNGVLVFTDRNTKSSIPIPDGARHLLTPR